MSGTRLLGPAEVDIPGSGESAGGSPGRRTPERVAPGGPPVPRVIRARRQWQTARLWLPALAGFAATFAFGSFENDAALRATVFAFVAIAVAQLLHDFPYPIRLIPASRIALALLPLLAAATVGAALAFVDADGFVIAHVAPGLVFGGAVAIALQLLGDHAMAARPLRIAVLGGPEFVPAIRRELEAIGGRSEFEVVGWLNLGRHVNGDQDAREETLGRVRAAITEHRIDLLVKGPGSAAFRSGRTAYETIAAGCLDLPVRMIDGNQLYEQVFGHVPIGTIDSAWFLFLMHPGFRTSSKRSKRGVDLAVGLLAMPIVLPLVVAGAIAITIGDRGPIFYRQRRVGERGCEFEILKLRTMAPDAQASGAQWASATDTRVTRVGKVLRRLHIDEMPQLVNVLRGEMTLVGPRPEQPQITAELERLFPHYSRRLLVKPGVTGWAQVRCGYAGTHLGTAWKLCHDLFYLKHRSLLGDLLIMLETIVIVTRDSHRPLRAPQAEFLYRVVEAHGLGYPDPDPGLAPPTPEIPLDAPAVPVPAAVPV